MKTVIGMDLGDQRNVVAVFDPDGKEVLNRSIGNTSQQVQKFFAKYPDSVVVMEAGVHSAWISRLLNNNGHEVLVGNPRKLKVIWTNNQKSDINDARILGLMYRLEPRLLHPIHHRNEDAQIALGVIKARAQLIGCRTKLITHVRSSVKGSGLRLPSCSAESFSNRAKENLPDKLKPVLVPVLDVIENLNKDIRKHEHRIDEIAAKDYPEVKWLRQVPGVGPITALAFVLTLEDPMRFEKSRQVGAFLGLTPRRDQSGDTDKQLPISKAGNTYLRQLLVGCAHYILGPFGPDSDLRRAGLRIANRGGKNAKKRAVVAVARKLAVLLHRLWADKAHYEPLKSDTQQHPKPLL
jgi:transposase